MSIGTPTPVAVNDRLIGLAEVRRQTSLSTSTIYRRRGVSFPDAYQLKGSSRVAWLQSEVSNWIAEQLTADK